MAFPIGWDSCTPLYRRPFALVFFSVRLVARTRPGSIRGLLLAQHVRVNSRRQPSRRRVDSLFFFPSSLPPRSRLAASSARLILACVRSGADYCRARARAQDSRINNRRAGDDERIMTTDAYYNSLSTVRFFFFFSLVRDGERNSAGTGRRERNDCNCINFRAGYSYRDVVAAPPRGNLFLHAEQKSRTSSQRYFRCLSDILWTFALFAFSSPPPPLPLVRKLRKQL